MKRTIFTTAAFAAMILSVPAANAADTTWQSVVISEETVWDGNWDDPNHWDSGVPDANDTAELPTSGSGGYIVIVSTASKACKTLTMHSDATLDVLTGGELKIGDADGQASRIDGMIELSTSTSALRFEYSHTVFGFGSIDGQDNGAKIEIADSKTLSNWILIEGNCQIVPAPSATNTTFTNNGTVHANNPGTLEIAPHVVGAGSGSWQVSTSGSAVLQFATGSALLTGSFSVYSGTLDIDASVTTTGNLLQVGGTIDVASGVTFSAS